MEIEVTCEGVRVQVMMLRVPIFLEVKHRSSSSRLRPRSLLAFATTFISSILAATSPDVSAPVNSEENNI
jgi:hypothetical protein